MRKISVVLAVFNEEDNLRRCLESVKNLAWEIVIVDGGSTDKTLEIARKAKARIIQTDNPINFHINKNKAIDAALGDWILQLDADEVVTSELSQEIKKKIATEGVVNGYWIPRKNFFLGRFLKKGGQYPDYTLRLYKRGTGRLPQKSVHEQAVVHGETDYLKNDLLHLRDKNLSIYIIRFNKYTSFLATQLEQKKVSINLFESVNFIFIKPMVWFIKVYFRHRGYVDAFPGFVFAFLSSLRFPVAYLKYCERLKEDRG